MNENGEQVHLSPEILVDLTEGVAVDAEWKKHLLQCDACSKKVEDLRQALAAAGDLEVPELDESYWEDFESRLRTRIESEASHRARSFGHWWVAAAAVALIIAGWVLRETIPSGSTPEVFAEKLLPPIEEDQEFQFLLSVAKLTDSAEDLDEAFELVAYSVFDPSHLSGEEREALRERLEQDLEAEKNAKS